MVVRSVIVVIVIGGSLVWAAPPDETVTEGKAPAPLAESGQYAANHTVSGVFEGVDLTDGVPAAKLDFVVEVTNDAGSGFLHGARGHCIGVALYQSDSPTGSGICSFKDPDGDLLHMRFAEDPFTSTGTAESIGGTGKYADIEVKQTHRTLESDELAGGRFEATGVRNGVWRPKQK